MSNLVELYYNEIKNNNITIDNVPSKLKEQVLEKLNADVKVGE